MPLSVNESRSINQPYNKRLVATGDKVAIEKLERQRTERMFGDIVVPDYRPGSSLCKGKVISIGNDAKKFGGKVGDIVLYDTFSVFYDTYPTIVTKIENILGIVVEQ